MINCMPEIKRVLTFTKATLKRNWQREMERWLVRKMRVGIAEGQRWPREADVVIMNYDIAGKHYHKLREKPWDLVILDESQYVKNRRTQRAKAIIGYVPSDREMEEGEKLIPPIPGLRRIALSGTPFDNCPEEMWTTLYYLDPDRWSSYWGYVRRYCGWTRENHNVKGATNIEELQRILRSTIMVRRLKSQVLTELPPKTRMVVEMDTTGLEHVIARDQGMFVRFEKDLEDAQVKLELARVEENDNAYKEAVANLRDAKFAFTEISRIRHETAVAKVPALIELLKDEVEDAGKVLVFGHHRDVLEPLHAAFPRSVLITGSTPPGDRQAICDRFQKDPRCNAFFGSIRACGEGLTLTAAKVVCFVEEDWSPAKTDQAESRAHRIGQKDNVLVKHFVLPGTIDARMIKTNLSKQDIIDRALNDDPGEVASEPVFVPHEPIGKRKELIQESLLLTSSQMRAIHEGVRMLSLVCDGARELDGNGYNKFDARLGHELARQSSLTPGQAALARRVLRKYSKQIGEELMKAMND